MRQAHKVHVQKMVRFENSYLKKLQDMDEAQGGTLDVDRDRFIDGLMH